MSEPTPVGSDPFDILDLWANHRPSPPPPEDHLGVRHSRQVTHIVTSGTANRPAWEIDTARGTLGPPTRPRQRPDFWVADTAVFHAAAPADLAESTDALPFTHAVAARMLWLDRVWYARLNVLRNALSAGSPIARRWVAQWRAMVHCPGRYGLFDTPTTRYPCNMRGFCPWCWARVAVGDYQRIEAAFYPNSNKNSQSPYSLTFRQIALACDDESVKAFARDRARKGSPISRERDIQTLRRETRGPDSDQSARFGFYEQMRLVPRRFRYGDWALICRQVILTPRGVAPPDAAPTHDAEVTSFGPFPYPGRHQVRRAVAWANRYPAFLLRGASDRVFLSLEARIGNQFSTTAGLFRGKRMRGGRR